MNLLSINPTSNRFIDVALQALIDCLSKHDPD
jgi:hypothetical protein